MIFGWDSFYFISDWLKKLTTHLLNSQMNPSSVENVNFLQDLIKHWELIRQNTIVQVNLCQKRSFFHQLTHNMTTDCSWNDKFSTRKIQVQNMLCTKIVLNAKTKNKFCTVHVFWEGHKNWRNLHHCKSKNSLSSYFGLVDAKIRASDKDLPVQVSTPSIVIQQMERRIDRNKIQWCQMINGILLPEWFWPTVRKRDH